MNHMEDLNYYNDSRVKAASFDRGKAVVNGSGQTFIRFVYENDDGEEITHHLPAKNEVCPVVDEKRCEAECPDILKLYEDDLQQQSWDYDEREQERRMGC